MGGLFVLFMLMARRFFLCFFMLILGEAYIMGLTLILLVEMWVWFYC